MIDKPAEIEKNLTEWLKTLGAIEGQKSSKTESGTPYITFVVGSEKEGGQWVRKILADTVSIFKLSIEGLRPPESQIVVREWPNLVVNEEDRFEITARLAFE